MDFNDEYIEIINDFIKKLNNDYNKKNLSKYKEDFEELKNIIETYPGKISILYPYLNNIFQFAYANYQNNPSEFNSKILSICGSYIGEIFEFWKDYKSAIHAYSYSFFVDGELQSISKLISVQIFQLILNNRQLGDEIYHIISELSNELKNSKLHKNCYINGNKITNDEAMEIINLYTKLSKFILERANYNLTNEDKKFFTNRIKFFQKELMLKGIKMYNIMKNIDNLLNKFE